MKKITLFFFLAGTVVLLSSCSFDHYPGNTAYTGQNKITKQGQKAQIRYAKRNIRQYGAISSTL